MEFFWVTKQMLTLNILEKCGLPEKIYLCYKNKSVSYSFVEFINVILSHGWFICNLLQISCILLFSFQLLKLKHQMYEHYGQNIFNLSWFNREPKCWHLKSWILNTRGGGGGSYFPYIPLNEIQTMFSQLAKRSARVLLWYVEL